MAQLPDGRYGVRDRGPEHRAKGIHFPPGSQEGKILAEIAPVGDALVLSKTCGSAFRGTNIEYLLRSMDRDRVVVVGSPSYLERAPAISTPFDLIQHSCLRNSALPLRVDWRLETRKQSFSVPVRA